MTYAEDWGLNPKGPLILEKGPLILEKTHPPVKAGYGPVIQYVTSIN